MYDKENKKMNTVKKEIIINTSAIPHEPPIKLIKLAIHRKNMLKQRLYGAAAAIVPVIATYFAEDVEMLLMFVPIGLFLMLTKKNILTFEQE